MDWFDLLAVQGTLKSLLQHHSSKESILRHSAFFMVRLSHPYMTTRQTRALIGQTFVSKGMSLLFNMLSRLVIIFLLRSNHLVVSWLQSLSAVILEPQKIKYVTVSIVCFPIYLALSCVDIEISVSSAQWFTDDSEEISLITWWGREDSASLCGSAVWVCRGLL